MTAIRTFFQEFWNRIPQIGVNDIIDILIVAFLFYTVMRLIRSTSAARIARSILLLLVVTGLTEIFKLYTLNWILSKILEIGVIALSAAGINTEAASAARILHESRYLHE